MKKAFIEKSDMVGLVFKKKERFRPTVIPLEVPPTTTPLDTARAVVIEKLDDWKETVAYQLSCELKSRDWEPEYPLTSSDIDQLFNNGFIFVDTDEMCDGITIVQDSAMDRFAHQHYEEQSDYDLGYFCEVFLKDAGIKIVKDAEYQGALVREGIPKIVDYLFSEFSIEDIGTELGYDDYFEYEDLHIFLRS